VSEVKKNSSGMSLMLKEKRRSLGSDSTSTVSSTIADELYNQNAQTTSNENSLEEIFKSNPTNVKIDGSKAIQVGDIIYNFYSPPSGKVQQSNNFQFTFASFTSFFISLRVCFQNLISTKMTNWTKQILLQQQPKIPSEKSIKTVYLELIDAIQYRKSI
jgi:hypothetical protein